MVPLHVVYAFSGGNMYHTQHAVVACEFADIFSIFDIPGKRSNGRLALLNYHGSWCKINRAGKHWPMNREVAPGVANALALG